MFSVDVQAYEVREEVQRLWPDETVEDRGLCLAEEVGELCRAILKRKEATRKTPEYWTEQLRKELGQVLCVALSISRAEGWNPSELIEEALTNLKSMGPDERGADD